MSTLEEKRFAEIAIKKGLATQDQIVEAQTIIDEAASQGQSKTMLDVLHEQKVIDQNQKKEIIENAEAAGPIKLGDFEVISMLGAGGMGAVYKAKEISLDRLCALKLLPSHFAKEPSIVARFRREAQACAKLDHPNIIRGYRVGEVDGQHFFAMELVEGTSVANIIEQSGPMPIDQVIKISREISSALIYAHKNGMIHRDIKPDNIMINKDGVAKLADLGLVKASDEENTRLTASGTGMGTPAYMPLEQARGARHVDARSDLYSLGATMYHMVTGRMPYEGASAYEVYQLAEKGVLKSPHSIRSDVPSWLDLVICKLMQRKPENRFQSAEELLQIINRNSSSSDIASDSFATGAPVTPSAPKASTPPSRIWHLRIKQKDGSIKKARAETHVLRELIKAGKISLTTMARQGEEGTFRQLSEYRGLVDRLKTSKPEQARDHHGSLKSFYNEIEVASRKRKRMKLIKRIVIRALVALAIITLVIVGISYRVELIEWVKGILGQ